MFTYWVMQCYFHVNSLQNEVDLIHSKSESQVGCVCVCVSENCYSKSIWKFKEPRIIKTTWKRKKRWRFILSELQATVIQTVWYWHQGRKRSEKQKNRIQIQTHTHSVNSFTTKVNRRFNKQQVAFSINGAGKFRYLYAKINVLKSRGGTKYKNLFTIDYRAEYKIKIVNTSKRKKNENLFHLKSGKYFLNTLPKVKFVRQKLGLHQN